MIIKKAVACSFTNLICEEIIEDASNDICLSMTGIEGKGCKYDKTNNKCRETDETCIAVTNVESCTNIPTSNPITLKCIMKTEGTNKK